MEDVSYNIVLTYTTNAKSFGTGTDIGAGNFVTISCFVASAQLTGVASAFGWCDGYESKHP